VLASFRIKPKERRCQEKRHLRSKILRFSRMKFFEFLLFFICTRANRWRHARARQIGYYAGSVISRNFFMEALARERNSSFERDA